MVAQPFGEGEKAQHTGLLLIFFHDYQPFDAFGKIHGVIKPDAPVFITHLARTLHPAQAELVKSLEGEFVVAYDGFEADI